MLLLHPALAALPCDVCKKYTHKDGVIERRRGSGKPIERNGRPPCDTCPKIPPGAEPKPENAETLTETNWRAYRHWQRCDSVNWQGCEDEIDGTVRHNAAVIREVREQAKREHEMRWLSALMLVGRTKRE